MSIFSRRHMCLILLLALTGGSAVLWAQAPSPPVAEVAPVNLLVGRSTVVDLPGTVTRVSVTSADIADVMVTSPRQLLVNGKVPGTISMFVWDGAGALSRFEVTVQRDLTKLTEQVKQLFPGEQIDVQSNGKNVVLAGKVSSKDVADRATSLAAGYVENRQDVVSLLQLQADAPSNQVLLRVRFAEVSRSALTELGTSYFTGANGYDNQYIGRVGTEQFGHSLPNFDNSDPNRPKLVFSDFLNLFFFDQKNQLGAVIKALQSKGQFQSLAEPNLVAESGKEASFLAGGEFPVPVAQGSGANLAISVSFKEFGIRLTFTPVVNGDRVHLKVRPEVSILDFANGVELNGFRIPALTTRRTETELELQNGQTFAIAGLMNNTVASTFQQIPGIGDIPILGLLFRSKAARKEQTELVVMITPEILPNNSRGVTPVLPRTPEQFLPGLPNDKTQPPLPPAFGGAAPAAPATRAANPSQPVPSAPAVSSAAAAATTVSALTPAGPRPIESTTPAVAAPAEAPKSAQPRVLTEQEKTTIERARQRDEKQAQERAKEEQKARAAETKRQAEQAAIARRKAEEDQKVQLKQAEEQAKRDREAAKRAEEARKKQAEADRERQKTIDEANARLKAAQASYEAELARQNKK